MTAEFHDHPAIIGFLTGWHIKLRLRKNFEVEA